MAIDAVAVMVAVVVALALVRERGPERCKSPILIGRPAIFWG